MNFRPIQECYHRERKRKVKAKALHIKEENAREKLDTFFHGKATDQSVNFDTKEINSFMELV